MLSNNRLPDALTLVKAQPDLNAPSDTAAIAASGARFREAMQAQQRAADADAASARQIRAHDAAEANSAAQRTTQALRNDRVQQQSVRDQAMHTSDMRALAARAATDRAAASEATHTANVAQQQSLRDANSADMNAERAAAQQTQNKTAAAQDLKGNAKDATRSADGADKDGKRLGDTANASAGNGAQAAMNVPGQPGTDAAIQAIAGRGQNDGQRSDGNSDSEGTSDDGQDEGQKTGSVGTIDATQTGTLNAAQAATQGARAGAAGAVGARDDASNGTSDTANGIASTDGSRAANGAATGSNAFTAFGGAAGAERDGALAASGAPRGATPLQGSAQNAADTGMPAQNGGTTGATGAAAFGAKLAAQRTQDDNASSGASAFSMGKKSDGIANAGDTTDASADLSADQSKSRDGAANAGGDSLTRQAADPSLLMGSVNHTADNALTAAGQAPANQTANANQAAYANSNIDMPFTDPRWADAVSQRVVMMSRNGNSQASLHLNPPNLGPVQVVLNMVGNQAQASFVAQHAHVRDALTAALPSLKDRFAESGMTLAQASVNDTMPANAAMPNATFNASLAAGLNTGADAGTGGNGQGGSAARDPFAVNGARRSTGPAVTTGVAANAWRPAGRPIDNGTGRSGIDTFA